MEKKILLFVSIVMISITVTSCKMPPSFGSYTFEFRVEKSSGGIGTPITKIEFINGSNRSDPVLLTETVHIGFGEMSRTYKVSGFTEKAGDEYRLFGILLTFESGATVFDHSSATNGAKIHAWLNGHYPLNIWDGDWYSVVTHRYHSHKKRYHPIIRCHFTQGYENIDRDFLRTIASSSFLQYLLDTLGQNDD